MKTKLSLRARIRLFAYILAAFACLTASNLIYMHKLELMQNSREAEYMRSVYDLCDSSDKIYTALIKAKCASDSGMLTKLSTEILKQASVAKNALLDLPLTNTELSATEKFFSQVGNYAYYIAEKSAEEGVSYDDYLTLAELCDNAKDLRDKLYSLETKLLVSDQTITELFEPLEDGSFLSDGLSGIEESFANTPKLIYDGPYSDHILEKTPLMTGDANPVSYDEALAKACRATDLDEWELVASEDEDGKMPSYRFAADGVNVSVTKSGGYLSYMNKARTVHYSEIALTDALRRTEIYLETLGISDMTYTYYETYNNVLTVNFAYMNEDVVCYTDLIKVSVALDNGEILGFDARGYLTNHRDRDFEAPKISKTQAMDDLSPNLGVVSSKLALIPSDNIDETLCWEFKCKTDDGQDVLVYVNVETGRQEDILILITMENSTLTA